MEFIKLASTFVIGAWVMYCTTTGDYAGAMTLLFVYIATMVIHPFRTEKKSASAGNTDTQNK